MIDKQTQDLAWASLPTNIRESAKYYYQHTECGTYSENLLEDLFGEHNLTSDAEPEPEEMLVVERKRVRELYDYYAEEHRATTPTDKTKISVDRISLGARLAMLQELFGSKCLPDEAESPKLSKVGKDCNVDTLADNVDSLDDSKAEPNPTNDNMEEKELNLCEILKGHENELFYSPIFGEVYLYAILTKGQPYPISLIAGGKERWINANGYWDNDYTENTMLVLYPSHESYLKYPLDAKKAWMEWQEEQKPKRWKANKGGEYWYINSCLMARSAKEERSMTDNERFKLYNYFEYQFLAQQAAEAVRKCLEEFHKNHKPHTLIHGDSQSHAERRTV